MPALKIEVIWYCGNGSWVSHCSHQNFITYSGVAVYTYPSGITEDYGCGTFKSYFAGEAPIRKY